MQKPNQKILLFYAFFALVIILLWSNPVLAQEQAVFKSATKIAAWVLVTLGIAGAAGCAVKRLSDQRKEEPLEKGTGELRKNNPLKEAYFSAFYPSEAQANVRSTFHVYAHTRDALTEINHDMGRFKDECGGGIPAPKTAEQSVPLQQGIPITVVPQCDEIIFEPTSLSKTWDDNWVRFDFDFKPTENLLGKTLEVQVLIYIRGIENARIDCPIQVVAPQNHPTPDERQPDNSFALAKQLSSQTTTLYQKIFVSYSRSDTEVVEIYRLNQLARGDDVFMDTHSLRTGEEWRAALAEAIDKADIIQLFWSANSAESTEVREEWEYALKYRDPKKEGQSFIRPVYWTKPMPACPRELEHLHFNYVPLG